MPLISGHLRSRLDEIVYRRAINRTAAYRLRRPLRNAHSPVRIAFLRDASDKNAMGKFHRYEAEQQSICYRAMMNLEHTHDRYSEWAPAGDAPHARRTRLSHFGPASSSESPPLLR